MISTQLKKTFNIPINLSCQRNISKVKIKQIFNYKCIHQLHVQEQNNINNPTVINFPLINTHKPLNNDNHTDFINCVHKPLMINLQKSQTSNGDRKYLAKYPSVTTILSNTKTNNEFFGLMQWRKANIEKHGKEKFGLMQRDTANKGTNFHLEMKTHFSNFNNSNYKDINNATNSGFFQSVANILPDITNTLAIESAVVHSQLAYAGTVDLVAEYLGKISIIDWKTSQRKRTSLKECHSYPLQLAAYAGAINYDADYPFQVANGVLVIAYENGDPADIHLLDEQLLEDYWDKWLLRLNEYRNKNMDETDWDIFDSSQKDPTEISTEEHLVNQGTNSDPVVVRDRNGTMGDFDKNQVILAHDVGGRKGCYAGASLAPSAKGSKGHYDGVVPVKSTKEHYCDGSFAPNLKSTKGQSLSFGTPLNVINCTSAGSRGKSLNEIGRIVKDEDIVATWRSLSGLVESVLGRTFLSKGLLWSHYIRTVLSRSVNAIFNPTDITRNRK